MKIQITEDEWYPMYSLYTEHYPGGTQLDTEVPDEFVAKAKRVMDLFEELQEVLGSLHGGSRSLGPDREPAAWAKRPIL